MLRNARERLHSLRMKLLLDQNISRKLVPALSELFPGTSHVFALDLQTASDEEVWNYAAAHEFAIVTQDSDFSERVAVYGHPPKVIWLRIGNTSTQVIESLLLMHKDDIAAFEKEDSKGFLIIW